jgi:hypothetical protein
MTRRIKTRPLTVKQLLAQQTEWLVRNAGSTCALLDLVAGLRRDVGAQYVKLQAVQIDVVHLIDAMEKLHAHGARVVLHCERLVREKETLQKRLAEYEAGSPYLPPLLTPDEGHTVTSTTSPRSMASGVYSDLHRSANFDSLAARLARLSTPREK